VNWKAKASGTDNSRNISPEKHRGAYWQFKPEYRLFDEGSGTWHFSAFQHGQGLKNVSYADEDNMQLDCNVPDNSTESFIYDEVRGCGLLRSSAL
jgi:hypothetical protein